MEYAIITENINSKWNDITGNVYHFPNRYLRYLKPGTKLIYYKSKQVDKSEIRKTKNPHYFAYAEVSSVYNDDENPRNSYINIMNFKEFENVVPIKGSDNKYFEKIPTSKIANYWRDGVRHISLMTFQNIINESKTSIYLSELDDNSVEESTSELTVEITNESIFNAYSKKDRNLGEYIAGHFSKNAKSIGDKGEKLVLEYLSKNLTQSEANSLVWHAKLNEFPGYDISYIEDGGEKVGIEVKSTNSKFFNEFIITANELKTFLDGKVKLKIALVVECSTKPKMQFLENINQMISDEMLELTPIAYKVRRPE